MPRGGVARTCGMCMHVRTEDIRVTHQRLASWAYMGLPGRKYFLRYPLHVHRGLERRGPLEPQVSFRPPATRKLIRTETLPDDTADIRVVDHAAEGRLEGGQLDDKTRVVPQSQLDGLGDESTIPNGVKV
jgi:hypothetical protein